MTNKINLDEIEARHEEVEYYTLDDCDELSPHPDGFLVEREDYDNAVVHIPAMTAWIRDAERVFGQMLRYTPDHLLCWQAAQDLLNRLETKP